MNPATRILLGLLPVMAAMAQPGGRGGADWTTASADAQRTAWARTDARINAESVQKNGFKMLWKLKVDDAAQLSQPVHMGATYGMQSITPFAFVASGAGNVFAMDGDLGRVLWKRQLPSPPACAGGMSAGLTRPTVLAPAVAIAGAGRAGGRGRAGVAPGGAVGAPHAGAANLADVVTAAPVATPTAGRGGGRGASGAPANAGGGGGRGVVNSFYTLSGDGTIHSFNVQNGVESAPALPFLPAGAKASGLILINNVVYAGTSQSCGGVANGLWAMNLASSDKTVHTWKSNGGGVAGSAGAAFGTDGTIYVATVDGDYSPTQFSDSVVALEGESLKMKDWYSTGKIGFDSTPVFFSYKGRDLLVVTSQDGRLHLLDSAALGGADHRTALFRSESVPGGFAGGSLASYEDAAGTRFVLAASAHSVIAYQVIETKGSFMLRQQWASRDLTSPLAPMVVNGVVFLAGSQGAAGVLYALDAESGKELWNSGNSILSAPSGGGLSVGGSVVYLTVQGGTLYGFGFPMER